MPEASPPIDDRGPDHDVAIDDIPTREPRIAPETLLAFVASAQPVRSVRAMNQACRGECGPALTQLAMAQAVCQQADGTWTTARWVPPEDDDVGF